MIHSIPAMPRYESYKDSGVEWIGEIPEHWEIKKLTHHLKYIVGFTPESGNALYYGKGYDWANIADLNEDYLISTKKQITQMAINKFRPMITPKGCLLFSFKLSVGAVSITTKDVYTNEAIASFYPSHSIIVKYLFFMAPISIVHNAGENIYGAKILNQEKIDSTKIIVPPIEEQSAITTFLDKKTALIDKAIQIKEKQIILFKEYKQIIIQNAVTKGLNPNAPMKDSGVEWIGEIPGHWEVKKFCNIFKLSKGLTITKEDLKDCGIPCINYGELHSKYGFEVCTIDNTLKCVDEEYIKMFPNSLLKQGDFIFADTSEDLGGSGNCTYVSGEKNIFAGYHTIIARPCTRVHSRFLAYLFSSEKHRNQIRYKVKGVKVYSITQTILKEVKSIFPPIKEQSAIATFLDNKTTIIDKAIQNYQVQINKLKEYKSSLIDSAVTGKIKVIEEMDG